VGAETDLARSGLSKKDARLMRVREFTADAVKKLTGRIQVAAYQLPYFSPEGKLLDYYRLRFLKEITDLKTGKVLRYWQPPKTAPHAYLPPHVDWVKFLRGDDEVVFTEGEKKAAAGAKFLRRAVVGLGGVFSFRSRAHRLSLLPELVPLVKNRRVLVCYDAEPNLNPDVVRARLALTQALGHHGAEVWTVHLPLNGTGEKVGLDDFLVAHGAEAFDDLETVRAGEEAEFERLNQELAYIQESHGYYHLKTGALFQEPRRLAQGEFAPRVITVYDARGETTQKNAVMEWIKWPRRTQYTRLTYDPGKPTLLDGAYNTWPGWGVAPARGPVTLFTRLVAHLFEGALAAHREWFLRWLAYPLQHPGVKLYTMTLLFSLGEGVGKSLVGMHLGRIYGKNFKAIKAKDLHSSFNNWARHKQFILGDEVTGRDRQEDIDELKTIATQEMVSVNEKYQPTYELPDRSNYLLTTNRPAALMMAARDRRFFVHEITSEKFPERFFDEYDAWYRSDAGAAALFYHLLNLPLGGFSPRAEAPVTPHKREMARLAAMPVEYDVADLLSQPGQYLLDSPRDLYTAHELSQLLSAQGRGHHAVSVGRALKTAGVPSFFVKTTRGSVQVYAVRKRERWLRCGHRERATHYDPLLKERGGQP
jgi:hypothetical protein